jgi:hypothetical protein
LPQLINRRAVSCYTAARLAGDRETMLASYHDEFTLKHFGAIRWPGPPLAARRHPR